MKRTSRKLSLGTLALGLTLTQLVGVSALVSIDTDTNTVINTRAMGVSASTSLTADINGGSSTDTTLDVDSSASGTTGITTMSTGNATLVFPPIMNSKNDLDVYKQSILDAETDIKDIDIDNENELSVSWEHEGKLFGYLPVTVISKTKVETENGTATVKTELPWWSAFITDIVGLNEETDNRLTDSEQIRAYGAAPEDLNLKAQALFTVVTELELDSKANGDAMLYLGK